MIDLKSILGLAPPAPAKRDPAVEDPAETARRELEALRAERARRQQISVMPSPAAPLPEQINARIQRDRREDVEQAEMIQADPEGRLAEQCRRSLARFAREAWAALHPADPLEWSSHHDALCDHLQWLLEGWMRKRVDPSYKQPYRQMIINLPPTTLKTELMMVFAPAWMWARCPSWRVLCLSCNPRVALTSATQSRRVIESDWYQRLFVRGAWKLLDDQNAKSDFGTTEGGNRQSHGMSATVVGEHADAIFVDDPTDPKEVTRAALDEANRDWPSLRNRVNDERSAIRIILQQRLDLNDLSGFVTQGKKGAAWIKVVMPIEFVAAKRCKTPMPVDGSNRLCLDPDKVQGTWADWRVEEQELIQPSRYPEDILEELRINAGPYGWSSQYQQDPVPRDGGRVKRQWLNFFRLAGHHAGDHRRPDGCGLTKEGTEIPARLIERRGEGWDFDWIYLTVDPASKKTDRGSLWGMLAVGAKGARRFLLDDPSKRGEIDEILDIIRGMVRRWRPARLLIEDTAAGPTLIKTLTDELASGKIRDELGRPIICVVQALTPAEVGGDKEARLDGVINQIAAGLFYLLEGAAWVAEFVNELTMFPNYPTKDRVDALTALLAVTTMSDTLWPEIKAERERAEAIARGEEVAPEASLGAKLSHTWLGLPLATLEPVDVVTRQPVHLHAWVEGRCVSCGVPAN